jgi:hypothetical protein
MRLLKRRRPKTRPISEAVAYARCHGERNELVRVVPRETPRQIARAAVSGETLRQAFEVRLSHRAGH